MRIKLNLPKINIRKPDLSKNKLTRNNYKRFFSKKVVFFVLLILLVVLNYLSRSYFLRLDLTDGQLFSLQNETKSILSELSEDVVIEVYFSDNTPPNLLEPKQTVMDMLEEFEKASNGKVKLDIKNSSDSSFETSAMTRGIRQIQYSEFQDDKFSVAQGFLGIAFVAESEVESIPVISSIDNLEYESISRILKLTKDQKSVIGLLNILDSSEDDESQLIPQSTLSSFSEMRSLLDRHFTTEEFDLTEEDTPDPKNTPVLVIIAPKTALDEKEFFALEQYMFKGGRVLILEDLLQLSTSTPLLNKTESNLNDFLKDYGLEVETKVLLDESHTPIISSNTRIAYPFWVLVGGDGINSEIPPLNTIESVTFPWANPMKKEEKTGLSYIELFNTTQYAWTQTGEVIDIDFQEYSPEHQKKYTIGYLVEGSAKSQFEESRIKELKLDVDTKDIVKETDNLKLVVIGDADFISDNFLQANEQNSTMFLNMVEWLSNSDDLSSIRSKSVATRPLKSLDPETKNYYKALNYVSFPVVISLFGYWNIRSRKNRKSQI